MKLLDRILRSGESRKLRALTDLTRDINELDDHYRALTDDQLAAKTVEFRQQLADGATIDDLLVDAFAVVREAADRTLGQRPYDVQLIGGAALHFGWVAEMRTGEGKTLAATLPAYLNALEGNGVHIVTVNDYLARRDANEMGRIHRALGLTVGLVTADTPPAARRAAYHADITYATNNELGFDYLRDNMVPTLDHKVQRGHHYCIVDEIDSILIDEARTPLIISGPRAATSDLYLTFTDIVADLEADIHYLVEEEQESVAPLPAGISEVEQRLGVGNLYDPTNVTYIHALGAALRAKELYQRDRDYIVADGEVKIVDTFTGRIQEGRRWSEGLHQAIEAKEGVDIQPENHTVATTTYQNYFRMYRKLAGMTGTAATEAAELAGTYELDVVTVPTHRPVARIDQPDLIYRNLDDKFTAIADDIADRHTHNQPVLIGTASVHHSEILSTLLTERGIAHHVLNAKQHTREAEIVAQAGRPGAVTVATNMAGRGVDIKLGGNPELLARAATIADGHHPDTLIEEFELTGPLDDNQTAARTAAQTCYLEHLDRYRTECARDADIVRAAGGLYVIGSERHESRRIDNQLRGRAGRQGDPGETRFYLSLDDEMLRLFAPQLLNWAFSGVADGTALESKTISKSVERAQTTVENRNATIRKNVLDYDEVGNAQRTTIYQLRDDILAGRDLRERALNYIGDAISAAVTEHCPTPDPATWDHTALTAKIRQMWATAPDTAQLDATTTATLAATLETAAGVHYDNLEREAGSDVVRAAERHLMLSVVDRQWREHLADMDYLREAVSLRASAQLDPLVQWRQEAYKLFEALHSGISEEFARMMMHVRVEWRDPADLAAGDVVAVARPATASPAATDRAAAEDTAVDDVAGGGS